MSFRPPSLVSPTSALTDRTFSLPGCASVHLTTASTATPTPSVLVSTIGDSIVPSSCTCVEPANLPKALPTNTAPGTFSRNRLPPCGTIAVTPVRTVSPAMRVVCPTRTPGHVGNGVQRSRTSESWLDPEIARPRASLGGHRFSCHEERPRQRRRSGRSTRREGTSSAFDLSHNKSAFQLQSTRSDRGRSHVAHYPKSVR